MITLTTNKTVADFFIISKGSKAGLPVKEATANCFAVIVDKDVLNKDYFFYYVLNCYNQKKFITRGSVIPFLTKDDIYTGLFS